MGNLENKQQLDALTRALRRYLDWQERCGRRVEAEQARRYWTKQQKRGAAIQAKQALSELGTATAEEGEYGIRME